MSLPIRRCQFARIFIRWRVALVALGNLLAVMPAQSAPLTLKELEFLVRQKTPDADIVREVTSRRLMAPLDATAVSSLKKNGASSSLISRLSAPDMALDPAAAATEARRQAQTKARVGALLAEDAERKAMRDDQWRKTAERLREARTVQGWLKDKLYQLHRFDLKPVESKSIDAVTVFAFFHGSMKSSPTRDFAPKLAEAYPRLKAKYGNDFEVIFVSHDSDEYNQKEFIRTFRLTCPTMKLGTADQSILQFAGNQMPWFVLVAENGKPLSINGVNKQFIEPFDVLLGLEQLLAAMHR
jgi:hypothetical protein